jgi:tellurite resistance-related uncharacterized protein
MKKLLLIACLFIAFSCADPGVTTKNLTGDEAQLPEELKGLKVYSVSCGEGEYVKVAILNGQINSATYSEGKTTETTIIVDKGSYKERTIYVKEVLSETDDIIVIRKK